MGLINTKICCLPSKLGYISKVLSTNSTQPSEFPMPASQDLFEEAAKLQGLLAEYGQRKTSVALLDIGGDRQCRCGDGIELVWVVEWKYAEFLFVHKKIQFERCIHCIQILWLWYGFDLCVFFCDRGWLKRCMIIYFCFVLATSFLSEKCQQMFSQGWNGNL